MNAADRSAAPPPTTHVDGEAPPVPVPFFRRAWTRWLRLILSGALLAGGIAFLVRQRHMAAGAGDVLDHIRFGWVAVALLMQACSIVALAALSRRLLGMGEIRPPLRTMTEITVAGNALAVSLPAGAAVAAAWIFAQWRRRGADRALATWVVLVAGALSSFALFLIAAAGIELAGSDGPAADLRLPALALALVPVAAAVAVVAARRWPAPFRSVRRAAEHLPGAHRLGRVAGRLIAGASAIRPKPAALGMAFGLALANWLLDCACLIACFWALGVAVPWAGLLFSYAGARVAASLPITPGGLGVVEGGLVFSLMAYGTGTNDALATVLLYRLISFWALVPVGWAAWGHLSFRRSRHDRQPERLPELAGSGGSQEGRRPELAGAAASAASRAGAGDLTAPPG